jgi:hypothetical protein
MPVATSITVLKKLFNRDTGVACTMAMRQGDKLYPVAVCNVFYKNAGV